MSLAMLAARIARAEENANTSIFCPAKEQGIRMSLQPMTLVTENKTCFCCAYWDNSYDNDGVTEIVIQRKKKKSYLKHGHRQHVCLPGV